MHCMTDRLPTLLFNFQTQNVGVAIHTGPDLDKAPVNKRGFVSQVGFSVEARGRLYVPERGFINRRLNMYKAAKSATTSKMPLDCP